MRPAPRACTLLAMLVGLLLSRTVPLPAAVNGGAMNLFAAAEERNPELDSPAERRRHTRTSHDYPVRVWLCDAADDNPGLAAEMRDISASGMYVRLAGATEVGSLIAAEVRLSGGRGDGARLRVTGRVTRAERLVDGRRGVAVAFNNHMFAADEKSPGGE
jgi:hypothetical protein